ncbi:uncharacterized protein [Dysidea avara]|uniref:uncharacterized protein n=1 Tax=Dysidea avara TaxID=196820 RepID=UPI003329D142
MAHVRVARTTPKGQSTKASDDKGKNFVALILDSPRGTDKCKRKLQLSEDDDVTKQQKPRKKKCRLLKNENVQSVAKVKTDLTQNDVYMLANTNIPANSTAIPASSTTTTTTAIPTSFNTTTAIPASSTVTTTAAIPAGSTATTTTTIQSNFIATTIPATTTTATPTNSTATNAILANRIVYATSSTTTNKQLENILKGQPSHAVKARIGRFTIHHGSFHTLKPNTYINDEIVNGYLRLIANIHGNCSVIGTFH